MGGRFTAPIIPDADKPFAIGQLMNRDGFFQRRTDFFFISVIIERGCHIDFTSLCGYCSSKATNGIKFAFSKERPNCFTDEVR